MSWKSDWLYSLIFLEVETLWKQARKEGTARAARLPRRFLVQECSEGNWKELECQPPVQRVWSHDGSGTGVLGTPEDVPSRVAQGMFFEEGRIRFHIAPDRKHVLWTHRLGPRYGRGLVFTVQGQGARATLSQDRSFGEWIS